MRAPAFWWREKPTLLARLLSLPAMPYGAFAGRRMQQAGEASTLPVICVGNFVAGGAGKTPAALALAKLLSGLGEKPVFLSRGYGGRLSGPVAVDAKHHAAADVGDEPLVLARKAPTVVAHDRPAGAALAARLGASVVIMDDGLQNPSLSKDCAVAVVDGSMGVGNGLCLPAGPLRAPLRQQLRRVQAVVIVGPGKAGAAVAKAATEVGVLTVKANLVPAAIPSASLRGRRVLAFAGIGHPEKFFATLVQAGAIIVDHMGFADHHVFSTADIAHILRRAHERELMIVTTEKDAARLAGQRDAKALLAELHVLPVSLYFDHEEGLRDIVGAALARRRQP